MLGPPARRRDDQVDVVGQARGRAGTEAYVDAEDLQERRLLAQAVVVAVVEGDDAGAEVLQGVGGGEPAHAESADDGAYALPRRLATRGLQIAFVMRR